MNYINNYSKFYEKVKKKSKISKKIERIFSQNKTIGHQNLLIIHLKQSHFLFFQINH